MKKINIFCAINGTGYGITSLNIVKNLHQLGLEISLFPIGHNIELNSNDEKFLIQELMNNANNFDYNAPCLKIWHQHDLASRIGNGKYYVFPFFEVDKLTPKEIHNINYADEIFTTTQWSKDILLQNNIYKPIHIAPLGVDASIFKIQNKIKVQNPKYVFFHIGKWETRKSQDFLISAFNKSFEEKDDVELWLVPYNPFLTEKEHSVWLDLVKNSKLSSKIKLFGRFDTQYDLAMLIDNADCGVFLSRAEGWNNEIPESMALNKPIIATNYSAHTEYCNSDNTFLVDVEELEPAVDGKWFNGFGNWAKLGEKQLEQTVEYMRFVYKNNIRTNLSGLETANKYSWKNTALIIDQTLENNKSYNANT